MKLAISNIGFEQSDGERVYELLKKNGFSGLEIAPTLVVGREPYDKIEQIKAFSKRLNDCYGLQICSMQSVWYGIEQGIFKGVEQREFLLEYTKKAILFAQAAGCANIVFGCPKNRISSSPSDYEIAVEFFKKLGDFASIHQTKIAFEANPIIYGTNFINTTAAAFELCKDVASSGFAVNIDLGTIIENGEDLQLVRENIHLANHIHISEPFLVEPCHKKLVLELFAAKFDKYYSIEMKSPDSFEAVKTVINTVKEWSCEVQRH